MSAPIERLLEIMARLRDPRGGCPWDVEQSFETIAPYTIEEAYEVDDAIRRGDRDALRDELGDLLLQVVFHAQMAREEGAFAFDDVVRALCEKLVRRHPHVFGDASVASAAAQVEAWEAHKAHERAGEGARSALDGVPLGLPALLRARKILGRAARAGLRVHDVDTALERVERGVAGLRSGPEPAAAIGSLLLALSGLARALEVDAEAALRTATAALERELRGLEVTPGRDPAPRR